MKRCDEERQRGHEYEGPSCGRRPCRHSPRTNASEQSEGQECRACARSPEFLVGDVAFVHVPIANRDHKQKREQRSRDHAALTKMSDTEGEILRVVPKTLE